MGEKIKRRRKELNMTLKELAGERITPGQISLVESGRSNPSMDLLEYIAITLNTSVEYLMETEKTQAEKICLYYEQIAESAILNDDIKKGEIIGEIVNPLEGTVEERLYAPCDGLIFTLRAYPMVERGSLIARILGGGGR